MSLTAPTLPSSGAGRFQKGVNDGEERNFRAGDFTRQETFRLIGAAGATAMVGGKLAGNPSAAQETGPSCVVTPALTEGPYFVDEKLNRSDIRTDPTDGTVRPGVPLVLKLNVLSDGTAPPALR